MKIEDGKNEKSPVVSEDEERSLDTTQESPGLDVVEDEDELPSLMLNSSFNDMLSSASEHTPKASRSSLPSVSMHLRHIDTPSPELVLQRRLALLIMTDRTPSPSLRYSLRILLVLLLQQTHLLPIRHQHRLQRRYVIASR